jgi:diguanylate cyclase (GGDEF)-like protein
MSQTIERLRTTDALTGLLARRVLLEELERRAKALLSMRSPQLTCLLMDLDHFKKLNDKHGHPMGDRVLKRVAKNLTTTVRDGDMIARFGGAEFAVLLGEASLDIAKKRAEAIRAAIDKTKIPVATTASIGVATISHEWLEDESGPPKADKVVQALLHRADHALQRAKKQGRNRVSEYRS